MTQHDYSIANDVFPLVRTDLNNALGSVQTLNSGSSAPSSTVAGMLWYDTTNSVMKQRNSANTGWNTLWRVVGNAIVGQDGAELYAVDAAGTDSYAITLSPAPSAYVAGMVLRVKVATANTGAATLNVNSLGVKTIKKAYNQDLSTGDILANQIIEVVYDGTNFQLLSVWVPPAATKSDQETGSSSTAMVTPSQQHQHKSANKAWAVVSQSAGTFNLDAGYNVASITKNATGDVTVTWNTAFSDANYAATATVHSDGTYGCVIKAKNANSATVRLFISTSGAASNQAFTIIAAGVLA